MLRRFLVARETFLVVAIVLIGAVTSTVHPDFLKGTNITSILVSAAVIGMLALGEALVIVGRGIDLSVSAILGLSALVIGTTANDFGLPVGLAFVLGLVIGLVLGAINAVLVVFGRIQPIIATVATLSVYSAFQYLYTNGSQVNSIPANLQNFGNAVWLGLPSVLWIFVVFVIACWYFGRHTALGRGIFATGNDERSAVLRGISVRKSLFATYLLAGALSGVGGFLYICYYTNATATTGPGTNDHLTAIAIALIGGTALTGGRASFPGVAISSVFLSMTLSVAVFFGVPGIWDDAAEGVLILIVVLTDSYFTTRASRNALVELQKIENKPVSGAAANSVAFAGGTGTANREGDQ